MESIIEENKKNENERININDSSRLIHILFVLLAEMSTFFYIYFFGPVWDKKARA